MAKKFDAKAKAKRQKIIAAVLGVAFVGVLAYEVPSLMKSKTPPAATAAPAAVPTLDAAAVAVTPAAAPVSAALVNSDPVTAAGTGQLTSFDRFGSKDPFLPQLAPECESDPVDGSSATCAATETTTSSTEPATTTAAAPPAATPPPPPSRQSSRALSTAAISVNGTTETVAVAGTFPSADPVFVLTRLEKASARVAIAGGSFDTGTSAVTLTKGKKVTLMNTADGTRYVLRLLSVA